MPFTVQCNACRSKFAMPDAIYEQRIAGKVVDIACKHCRQSIRVDGTQPRTANSSNPAPAETPKPNEQTSAQAPAAVALAQPTSPADTAVLPPVAAASQVAGSPAQRSFTSGADNVPKPAVRIPLPTSATSGSSRAPGMSRGPGPVVDFLSGAVNPAQGAGLSAPSLTGASNPLLVSRSVSLPAPAARNASLPPKAGANVTTPNSSRAGGATTQRSAASQQLEAPPAAALVPELPHLPLTPKVSEVHTESTMHLSVADLLVADTDEPTVIAPLRAKLPPKAPPRRPSGERPAVVDAAPAVKPPPPRRNPGLKATMMGVAPPANAVRRDVPPSAPTVTATEAAAVARPAEVAATPEPAVVELATPPSSRSQRTQNATGPTQPGEQQVARGQSPVAVAAARVVDVGASSTKTPPSTPRRPVPVGGTMLGLAPPTAAAALEWLKDNEKSAPHQANPLAATAVAPAAAATVAMPRYDQLAAEAPAPLVASARQAQPDTWSTPVDSDAVLADSERATIDDGPEAPLREMPALEAKLAQDWDTGTTDVSQLTQSVPTTPPVGRGTRRGRWALVACVTLVGAVLGTGFVVFTGRVVLPEPVQSKVAAWAPALGIQLPQVARNGSVQGSVQGSAPAAAALAAAQIEQPSLGAQAPHAADEPEEEVPQDVDDPAVTAYRDTIGPPVAGFVPQAPAEPAAQPEQGGAQPTLAAGPAEGPQPAAADPEAVEPAAPEPAAVEAAAVEPSAQEAEPVAEDNGAALERAVPSGNTSRVVGEPGLAQPVSDVPEGVDMSKLQYLMNLAIGRARKCHPGGRATGTAKVLATFGPDGTVREAKVQGEPIASAPVSRCILTHAQGVAIKPFKGKPFTVSQSITLR